MSRPTPVRYGPAATRLQPRRGNPRMLAEVAEGLALPQKELPPKYFYDQRGSELFEEITRLPEYYPTRAERALLEAWMPGRGGWGETHTASRFPSRGVIMPHGLTA